MVDDNKREAANYIVDFPSNDEDYVLQKEDKGKGKATSPNEYLTTAYDEEREIETTNLLTILNVSEGDIEEDRRARAALAVQENIEQGQEGRAAFAAEEAVEQGRRLELARAIYQELRSTPSLMPLEFTAFGISEEDMEMDRRARAGLAVYEALTNTAMPAAPPSSPAAATSETDSEEVQVQHAMPAVVLSPGSFATSLVPKARVMDTMAQTRREQLAAAIQAESATSSFSTSSENASLGSGSKRFTITSNTLNTLFDDLTDSTKPRARLSHGSRDVLRKPGRMSTIAEDMAEGEMFEYQGTPLTQFAKYGMAKPLNVADVAKNGTTANTGLQLKRVMPENINKVEAPFFYELVIRPLEDIESTMAELLRAFQEVEPEIRLCDDDYEKKDAFIFELHKDEVIPAELQTLHWHEKIQICRYDAEENKFSDWISKFEPSPLEKKFMEKYNKSKGLTAKPVDNRSTASAMKYAKQRLEEIQRVAEERRGAEKERERKELAAGLQAEQQIRGWLNPESGFAVQFGPPPF